jgi:hypothetical protein
MSHSICSWSSHSSAESWIVSTSSGQSSRPFAAAYHAEKATASRHKLSESCGCAARRKSHYKVVAMEVADEYLGLNEGGKASNEPRRRDSQASNGSKSQPRGIC